MFESGFTEGSSAERKSRARGNTTRKPPLKKSKFNPSADGKRHVVIEDDYDLFHNVLYYIYTNRITFSTDLTIEPIGSTIPRLCGTEDIYGIANKMFLDDLKLKALDFINFNCTVENITHRLFSKFAYLYKDVGEMYADYFRDKLWGYRKNYGVSAIL